MKITPAIVLVALGGLLFAAIKFEPFDAQQAAERGISEADAQERQAILSAATSGNRASTPQNENRVFINPDVRANPDEYLAAQMALPTVLKSCGSIDMVVPSTIDPGGWVIDCANGDRYRIGSGERVARYERHYNWGSR